MNSIGIERINFYTPPFYLSLDQLAFERHQNPDKYRRGLGQHHMSQSAPDEDIVTMGVKAAEVILQTIDRHEIETLIFATESGIDQAKAAGVYAHSLLKLSNHCRVVEVKQACYAATAALQFAAGQLLWRPNKKVLIIASDIARYDLESPGEATQGAGAVALLISHNPLIATIEPGSGLYCRDVHDFWRPNYRTTPLVDGKFSTMVYLEALKNCFASYQQETNRQLLDHQWFCYHTPFASMAKKAHQQLLHHANLELKTIDLEPTLAYNREIGNCYTASLYVALISLLETKQEDLSHQRVGLFSYGSGATAEFFSLTITPGYQNYLFTHFHQNMLANREEIDFATYCQWHQQGSQGSSPNQAIAPFTPGLVHYLGTQDHQRFYQ